MGGAAASQACALLGISWDTAQQIMERAVARGLDRRQLEGLRRLGMDEKSFKRGQSYITLLTDLEQGRVLDVEEERTEAAAAAVWLTLSPEQKQQVEAAAVEELMARGDETPKGTRQLWLYNPQHFSEPQAEEYSALKDLHLKAARAWAAKELFSKFWEYQQEGWARRFFKHWSGWVGRSQLKPVVEVPRRPSVTWITCRPI